MRALVVAFGYKCILGIEYLEGESFSDRNGVAQECQARGYDEAGGDTPPAGHFRF